MARNRRTYNPCDDCQYSFALFNQDHPMCKICEFKQLLAVDLVPKSEVEKLEQDVTRLVQEKDALIKNYAQCMKDYARDIFDEISKDSENWGSYCISAFKWGYVTTDVSKTLAKLRKKYVEGEI